MSLEMFKLKVQESGRPCTDFKTESFFATDNKASNPPGSSPKCATAMKAPPRLVSDQMINIFFQEWAPLFPVLHRPTFLDTYTNFVAYPEGIKDRHAIAQLNLVFGIAALSTEVCRIIRTLFIRHADIALRATGKELLCSKASGRLQSRRFTQSIVWLPYNA